jgi:AcrR family transcriptional regulator
MKTTSERPPRIRRTAEEARTAILDATERRMVASGTAGIRLQDVADDVGVTHPTILHHFGSRERLVEAVTRRRVDSMKQEVIYALVGADHGELAVEALFQRLYAAMGPGGHARVVAFLALEGHSGATPESLLPLAEATHAKRIAHRDPSRPAPPLEDTYFMVMLVAFGLFGEAIAGPLFRGELSEDGRDEATSQRFLSWFAKLVHTHLER